MSKYHFVFEDKRGLELLEYDTDSEPPRVGDLFEPSVMTGLLDEGTYRVTKVLYKPQSSEMTIVFIELDETED